MRKNEIRSKRPWWKRILPYAAVAAISAGVFYLLRLLADRARSDSGTYDQE